MATSKTSSRRSPRNDRPTGSPKKRAPKATSALEDSATRPSRKSTRGSSNRARGAQPKELTMISQSVTPAARAARSRVSKRSNPRAGQK